MTEKFTKLLDIIDADWIEEDPGTAMELIEALISDVRHYKEVVEMQRELLLLTKAILESKINGESIDVEKFSQFYYNAILESKGDSMDEKKREALMTLGRIS